MRKQLKTVSTQCGSCGRWFFYTARTRPRQFCNECAEYRKAESNKARQRAFRQRKREAQTTSHKQPDDRLPRPVADGSRASVARATVQPQPGGLFASVPNPGRAIKRKALGLP